MLSSRGTGAAEGPQKPLRWSPELSNSFMGLQRQREGDVLNNPNVGDGRALSAAVPLALAEPGRSACLLTIQ